MIASPSRTPLEPASPDSPRRPRSRLRRLAAATTMLGLVLALFTALSAAAAFQTPGNESFQAKWADWLRNHHGSAVVNQLEHSYYAHQAPPVGGRPKALGTFPPPTAGVKTTAAPTARHPAPPKPVRLVVPGLPGEGVWRPTGPLVNGRAAMYVAEVRPDRVHTSVLTTLVWVDPTALRVRLVPGAQEPGGQWSQPPSIEGAARRSIVAAFNGGFRVKDAHGGFYAEHRAQVPLRDGAASLAIGASGKVDVGQWGRDLRMTPTTESVIQNLVLLVDHGHPVPGIAAGDTSKWGQTLGNKVLVWRSAIGVDSAGGLLYVAGPGLQATTLADVLTRAGTVRAMTLDMNPEWVTFNFFDHPDPHHMEVVQGRKLIDTMRRPADRYLSKESRDFFTVSTS